MPNKHEDLTFRLWYLPDTWLPHLMLTYAPLTFGHSQLVIPSLPDEEKLEEKFFGPRAKIIKMAISVFRKAFLNKNLHENEKFEELSRVTKTYGRYFKTLIVKISADEGT